MATLLDIMAAADIDVDEDKEKELEAPNAVLYGLYLDQLLANASLTRMDVIGLGDWLPFLTVILWSPADIEQFIFRCLDVNADGEIDSADLEAVKANGCTCRRFAAVASPHPFAVEDSYSPDSSTASSAASPLSMVTVPFALFRKCAFCAFTFPPTVLAAVGATALTFETWSLISAPAVDAKTDDGFSELPVEGVHDFFLSPFKLLQKRLQAISISQLVWTGLLAEDTNWDRTYLTPSGEEGSVSSAEGFSVAQD